MMQDWFWAARRTEPARDAFVIENGQKALWSRVHQEIAADEHCSWNAVHPGKPEPTIEDFLSLLLIVVPTYRVNHNRFVFEAAKVPVFARFLRNAPEGLSNFVSNSIFSQELIPLEPYSKEATKRLGRIVSSTLEIEDDWVEY